MDITYKENIHIKMIITILIHFLKFRKLELIETDLINLNTIADYEEKEQTGIVTKKMGDINDSILNVIKSNGYIKIDSISSSPRGIRNIVSILILSVDNSDAKKILKGVITNIDKENNLDECIIISDKSHFDKKTFIDFITELKIGEIYKDYSGRMPIFNAYPTHNFIINVPQCVSVANHLILSDKEIDLEFNVEYIRKKNIKTIFQYDPMVIWLGGKCGNVIKITRYSHSTLKSIEYRLVKPGIFTPN